MTISRRSLITTSTAGAIAAAIAPATIAATSQTASPVASKPNIEDSLSTALQEHGIPGALVLVDSPEGGLWTAAAGVADLDTGAPMTADMHMRIGSITKTFTATMVLQLVDQGVVALTDTLASLLPDLAELPNASSITLRQILTMQSGLPDYVATEDMAAIMQDPTPDLDHVYTPTELLGFIAGKPAEFAPGTQGMYSNTNYMILSMIAEQLTGTPWRDLIRTGILDEAGLANTSLPETPELPEPAPRGYAYAVPLPGTEATPAGSTPSAATPVTSTGPTDVTAINPSISNAAGSMISTLADLNTWMSVLREGTLLSPELHEDRFDLSDATVLPGAIEDLKYGLGLSQVNGMLGHDGGISGFRSTLFYDQGADTTIITLANCLPTRDGSDPAAVVLEATSAT